MRSLGLKESAKCPHKTGKIILYIYNLKLEIGKVFRIYIFSEAEKTVRTCGQCEKTLRFQRVNCPHIVYGQCTDSTDRRKSIKYKKNTKKEQKCQSNQPAKNCSRRNKPKQCKRKPGEYICLNWSGDFKVIRSQELREREEANND